MLGLKLQYLEINAERSGQKYVNVRYYLKCILGIFLQHQPIPIIYANGQDQDVMMI